MKNKKAPHHHSTEQERKHSKNINFRGQKKLFFEYLLNNTVTASMASDALSIQQKNITRYKRLLERQGKLIELFTMACDLTGFNAAYLTTNPDIIQKSKKPNDGDSSNTTKF